MHFTYFSVDIWLLKYCAIYNSKLIWVWIIVTQNLQKWFKYKTWQSIICCASCPRIFDSTLESAWTCVFTKTIFYNDWLMRTFKLMVRIESNMNLTVSTGNLIQIIWIIKSEKSSWFLECYEVGFFESWLSDNGHFVKGSKRKRTTNYENSD